MDKSNSENSDEHAHSSLTLELERDFKDRLTKAIGDRSVLSFAKECGFSDSLVRKYLAGTLPGLDKVVVMAKVAGVSVQWLATGTEIPPLGQPQIDYDKLEEVMIKTLRLFQDRGVKIKPESQARIIRLLYEYVQRQGKEMDEATLNNVIQLAAYR